MPHVISINGRRWFQKTYGNTYHTVTVHIDGEHLFTAPKQYGYGDQYLETAMAAIHASGKFPPRTQHANGSHEANYQWAERVGAKIVNSVADVSRERDL